MLRLPSLPVVLLAAALGLSSAGCAGFGDFLLHPGGSAPAVADEPAGPPVSRAQVLSDEAAAQQNEALTAALDRLNATQARLQLTLQDLQKGAVEQGDSTRRAADELQGMSRLALVAGIAAAAALLIALLLAVIVVRQSSQVRRAVRALAQAEADMEEQLQDAVGGAGRGQQAGVRRGARDGTTPGGAAATFGAGGTGATGGPRAADAGATGPAAPGGNIARLRKRPPVG